MSIFNIGNNGTIQLEPAAHTEGAINLKLKNAVDSGVAVGFKVKNAEGEGNYVSGVVYQHDSIAIPLDTGKYTIEPVFSAAQQQ